MVKIKGITVEIGVDTTKLQTALRGVNTEIRNTQSQLRDVDKLLKLDPGNTELLAQKHRLLGDAVKETKEKLETLKTAAVEKCIAFVRTLTYNMGKRKGSDDMAAKSANLYARIEPDVKEQAEGILATLGISASTAINMFYKQIILNRGLPFEVKIPTARPVDISRMNAETLDMELEKGYADMQAGRIKSAAQVFADIRRDYNV